MSPIADPRFGVELRRLRTEARVSLRALAQVVFQSKSQLHDAPGWCPSAAEVHRHVGHAWLTFQHGHYAQLVRMLPGLLQAAQRLHAVDPRQGVGLLVEADRLAAAEVRCRPVGRTVLAEVYRDGPPSAGVARLVTAIGVVRPPTFRGMAGPFTRSFGAAGQDRGRPSEGQ
ncbi:hypothetical protein [Micromonospora sp. SH-82]|uniref:hypothetical protein n=1 Tax=Micromonospora sp. SH-82 TaxID=3132938 RepID=UPI003EB8E70E